MKRFSINSIIRYMLSFIKRNLPGRNTWCTIFVISPMFCAHSPKMEQNAVNKACRAVRTDNRELLERLINGNPNLTRCSEILHLAAALAKPVVVSQLLKLGFKANCVDKNGRTALHALCNPHLEYTEDTTNRLAELVDLLIEHGANIDGSTENVSSPLFHALRNQQSELVEILLSHQPHLCTTKMRIASHLAICKNDLDSLKHILFFDPELVNMPDHAGRTPLDIAVINNYEEIIHYLLSFRNLALDTLRWALFHAVDASRVRRATLDPMLRRLRTYGPDTLNGMFHCQNFHGTALAKAAYRRNIAHVEALLSFGAKVVCPNNGKELPLHAVAQNRVADNTQEIAGLLLAKEPATVNWRTLRRQTALSLATRKGNERLALFLLAHGAVTNRAAGGRERLYRDAAGNQLKSLMQKLR